MRRPKCSPHEELKIRVRQGSQPRGNQVIRQNHRQGQKHRKKLTRGRMHEEEAAAGTTVVVEEQDKLATAT